MQKSQLISLYKVRESTSALEALAHVLDTGAIAGGKHVARFESELGSFLGVNHLTTMADVSSALCLSLYMAGVRPDTEVIASPMACLATNIPVLNLFARVRWADVDPATGNMDPHSLDQLITSNTRAILLFHWAGNPAPIADIYRIAKGHNIPVVEDAGEALGAEYGRNRIGNTGGDFAVFSFYPNRHLHTIDGAAVTFASKETWEKARWLKRYGIHQPTFRDARGEIDPTSDIPEAGWNSYLSNAGACVGLAQIPKLPAIVEKHRDNGQYLDRELAGIAGIRLLRREPGSVSAYWVYTLLAERRDELIGWLKERGIQSSKVHLRNDVYSCFGPKQDPLPGLDSFAKGMLSIPCGWWVSNTDRQHIVSSIQEFYRN